MRNSSLLFRLQQRFPVIMCWAETHAYFNFSTQYWRGNQILTAVHMMWNISRRFLCLSQKTIGCIERDREGHIILITRSFSLSLSHVHTRTHTHSFTVKLWYSCVRCDPFHYSSDQRDTQTWTSTDTDGCDFSVWKGFTTLPPSFHFLSLPAFLWRNTLTDIWTNEQTTRYLVDWRTSGQPRQPDPRRPNGWRRYWWPRGSHVFLSGSLLNSL